MKPLFVVMLSSLIANPVWAGANCAHSQSWQCTHPQSTTGTVDPGAVVPEHLTQNPATGTTNPPLGGTVPDHHNVVLTPTSLPNKAHKGTSSSKLAGTYPVPTPQSVATPHITPKPTPQPKPVATPYPVPQPVQVPPQQPVATPHIAPKPTPQPKPVATPYPVPQPVQVPPQQPVATPHITPKPMPQPKPVVTPYPVPQPVQVPPQQPVATPHITPKPTPQPKPVATPYPVPQPVQVPPQQPVATPHITPKPTLQPKPVATPYPVPQPMQVPPQQPVATPHITRKPTPQPKPVTTSQQRPVMQVSGDSQRPQPTPGQQHTGHMLVTHQSLPAVPGAGSGAAEGQYGLEMIEPGIENHRVEVYRSGDVHEAAYHDNIPVDAGGFNLTVIGTRNPNYMH